MKTVRIFWLTLTLFVLQLSVAAAGDTTRSSVCATEVAENKLPKTKLGFPLRLNQRPFATSFSDYLHNESPQKRFASQIEKAALILAYSDKPSTRSFQSNPRTLVKYDSVSREILVLVDDKIVFYEALTEEDDALFNGLRKANLRTDVSIPDPQPFSPSGLITHYDSHGKQFDVADAEEYELRAIEFAKSNTFRSMTIEVEDRGRKRWVKMDFNTRELVVVAQDSRQIISYYVRERHPFLYFLRGATTPRSASSR